MHGAIPLTKVEVDLIDTQAFQRLRNVKHLGLAHYVFPGADFSRLSHSLGVCHVTGRILEALREREREAGNAGDEEVLDDERVQRYRLAGLLHDIGHYPLSHTYEHAVRDVVSGRQFHPKSAGDPEDSTEAPEPHLKHEKVSQLLLTADREIASVLERHGIDPDGVSRAFMGEESPPRYQKLITSDLDADRIDYLMRTAHHTGLPYGRVDLDYLLAQIQVDRDLAVCLNPKALHTAEHLLVGRYFDRQSVTFHKTVVGLEWILAHVIGLLVQREKLPGRPEEVRDLVESGAWRAFDDVAVFNEIRALAGRSDEGTLERVMADALLNRNPPRLLGQSENLGGRQDAVFAQQVRSWTAQARRAVGEVADHFDLDPDLFHITDEPNLVLTKVGAHIPVGSVADELTEEEMVESVRIAMPDGSSRPITEEPSSLVRLLSDYALYRSRAYVLLPPSRLAQRAEIEENWADIMREGGWDV